MTWNIEWFPKNGQITINYVKQIIEASHIASLTTFLASPLSIAVTGETIAAGGGVGSGIYY